MDTPGRNGLATEGHCDEQDGVEGMDDPVEPTLFTFAGDSPAQLSSQPDLDLPEVTEEQEAIVRQVCETVQAYLDAVQTLAEGKYSHLAQHVPAYLKAPGTVIVACCEDGVVIRFERRTDRRKILGGWWSDGIARVAAKLSQNYLHCHWMLDYQSEIPNSGVKIEL